MDNPIISNEVVSGAIIDSDKTQKTKYIVIGMLAIIFLLFLSFSYVIYRFIENTRVEDNNTTSNSSVSTSLSSSTNSSVSLITYKDFINQFVIAKIPADSNPIVDSSENSKGLVFESFQMKYKNLDINIGPGCLETNCQIHTLEYDLKSPSRISWRFEYRESLQDAGESVISRNGSTTMSKIPEKYISKDGNYLFLYSDEFKKLDNKTISNFLVFKKKDGKYVASTLDGIPFISKDKYSFEINCTSKNKNDFNICSEISLKLLETFKVK